MTPHLPLEAQLASARRRLEAAVSNHEPLAEVERLARRVRLLKSRLEDALLVAERDENTCRMDMKTSEYVALGRKLEEIERPKARARERAGVKVEPSGKIPKGSTKERIGKALGVSGSAYTLVNAKLSCGHQASQLIISDEGTSYCASCEREARQNEPGGSVVPWWEEES